MNSSRRRGPQIGLLAMALLCVLLVSHLFEVTDALALQESSPSSLPALAPEKEASPEVPVSPVVVLANSERPVKRDEPAAAPASRTGESQETTTSQQTTSTTAAPEKQSTSDSSSSGGETGINKDDINTLLASKNDSENDLTSSSVPAAPVKPTSGDALDSPVDTAAPTAVNRVASSVGNRFHYSMSGDSATDKSGASEEATTTTAMDDKDETTTVKLTEEIFELHEETSKGQSKPELKPESKPTSSSPASAEPPVSTTTSTTTTTTTEADSSSTQIGGVILKLGDVSYDEKTDTYKIKVHTKDAESTNQTSGVESTKKEDANQTFGITSITINIPDEVLGPKPTSSIPPSETAKEEKSPVPNQVSSSPTASPVETSTTTTARPVESSKPVDVPSVVAAAVGSAIGSAFGAAVKPMLSREKSTPAVAATTTTTTTTLKPSSMTTLKSSSDKWNRWSPSTPSIGGAGSSSSPPPSTRRRPILPSIRRRFRPYNRLNPFPWGVDSYSPGMDGDYMPAVDQPQPSSSSSRPPSGVASNSKPRRRSSTSTTTEVPKSTAGSRSRTSSSDSDSDDDASDRPSTSSRRANEPGRRRHNHQDRQENHHHRHHHHNRNRNHDQGGSEFGGNDEHGYRRRHHQSSGSPNRHFGSRDSDSPFRSPFGGSSADVEPSFSSHPNGFSLFNTGSSGSGFDLLNPFSGWLDGASNRPSRGQGGPGNGAASGSQVPQTPPSHIGSPGRLPGRQPIPVEGEYDSNADSGPHRPREPHPHPSHHQHGSNGRDTHIHVGGGRPPIITTGGGGGGSGIYPDRDREDYDGHHGHHGHDCHDHEYDHGHHEHHREPYRPNRPGRDPYRPYGEDGYSGSRPGRPYNRRDESELSSSSSSDSSSQNSTGSRARPERERSRHEGTPSSESSAGAAGGPSLPHGSSFQPAAASAPKRIGPSFFSPFESLFGALDDELFNLRSTFIDGSPLRSAGSPIRPPELAGGFADTIISSPKISMPPSRAVASDADKLDAADEADEAGKTRSAMAVRSFEPDGLSEDTDADAAAAGAVATKRPCSSLFRSWPCLSPPSASSSSSLLKNPILEFLSRL